MDYSTHRVGHVQRRANLPQLKQQLRTHKYLVKLRTGVTQDCKLMTDPYMADNPYFYPISHIMRQEQMKQEQLTSPQNDILQTLPDI